MPSGPVSYVRDSKDPSGPHRRSPCRVHHRHRRRRVRLRPALTRRPDRDGPARPGAPDQKAVPLSYRPR
ncbi:hypothetical protein [Kitasatospora sp. NPDC058218]|uniref:hypothetical protein n=1 Tax=Kitasatospora sp. NPDC058218 TaxID=3346385 RepID=UPI0036DD2AFF